MYSTMECFSGECGLCRDCCVNTMTKFKYHDSVPNDLSERGNDLSKLMGKQYVEEVKDRYNKNLKMWCRKYKYEDPVCFGSAPEEIRENFSGKNEKFKIINKKHTSVCSDPYCRMLYFTSTEWEHKTRHSMLPMYNREGDNLKLCGPCLTNDSYKST